MMPQQNKKKDVNIIFLPFQNRVITGQWFWELKNKNKVLARFALQPGYNKDHHKTVQNASLLGTHALG